jgi:hypothetical protein
MTVLIRQQPAASLDDVARQLDQAFTTAQAAMAAGDPLVIVAHGADLLGQRSLEDAAVAGGLLGLMRAIAFEGGAKGWHVNLVAVDPGQEPAPELVNAAVAIGSLNGQVLSASSTQFGKLIP